MLSATNVGSHILLVVVVVGFWSHASQLDLVEAWIIQQLNFLVIGNCLCNGFSVVELFAEDQKQLVKEITGEVHIRVETLIQLGRWSGVVLESAFEGVLTSVDLSLTLQIHDFKVSRIVIV